MNLSKRLLLSFCVLASSALAERSARAADPTGGLFAAAGAVLATAPVALLARTSHRARRTNRESAAVT